MAKPTGDLLKHERACYIHALKARFYRLAVAIDDLNRGTVDPLLRERRSGG
jgi:hypothetical protein